MKVNFKVQDLFSLPKDEYLFVQCISSDAKMGAGIAVQFLKEFPELHKFQQDVFENGNLPYPSCYKAGMVFLLITKERFWHKPTMWTMTESLKELKSMCVRQGISKLAMPQIGCGIDKLNWTEVSSAICEIFADTDIEITVCVKG